MGASDPAASEDARERIGRSDAVAELRPGVCEVAREVQMDRARDVRGRVLGARVALLRGQVPARVDHAQVWIRKPRLEPGAVDEQHH
ncbi:MAG: hypothetical protein FJ108_12055 [Deltaproteobacteria bacterium]|nr:hypothetical protein [Deltaproteobacteria bacterium]